jgi:predicted RNA-binding protein with PIN domain
MRYYFQFICLTGIGQVEKGEKDCRKKIILLNRYEEWQIMSLWILIDGYNLLRQSPFFGPIGQRDMEEARDVFIDSLRRYKKVKACRITVVFDGHRSGGISRGGKSIQGIEVLFSRPGEEADDVIKRMASKLKDGLVVVTSDREVANFSERAGAAVIESGEFEERMEMALYEDLKGEEVDREDDIPSKYATRKRGPSSRPPRKKRRVGIKFRKL